MNLILYYRDNIPWHNTNMESYTNSGAFGYTQYNPKLLSLVKRWNDTFNISFFSFRNKLKRISRISHANIPNIKIVIGEREVWARGNIHKIDMSFLEGEDFIIIPSDDDDWLHPQVFEEILKYKNSPMISWDHVIFRLNSLGYDNNAFWQAGAAKIFEYSDAHCFTNNYALTSEFLKNYGMDRLRLCLYHDGKANDFANEVPPVLIPQKMSVSVKTMASLGRLDDFENEDEYFSYFTKLLPNLRDQFDKNTWYSSYTNKVISLHKYLREKKYAI